MSGPRAEIADPQIRLRQKQIPGDRVLRIFVHENTEVGLADAVALPQDQKMIFRAAFLGLQEPRPAPVVRGIFYAGEERSDLGECKLLRCFSPPVANIPDQLQRLPHVDRVNLIVRRAGPINQHILPVRGLVHTDRIFIVIGLEKQHVVVYVIAEFVVKQFRGSQFVVSDCVEETNRILRRVRELVEDEGRDLLEGGRFGELLLPQLAKNSPLFGSILLPRRSCTAGTSSSLGRSSSLRLHSWNLLRGRRIRSTSSNDGGKIDCGFTGLRAATIIQLLKRELVVFIADEIKHVGHELVVFGHHGREDVREFLSIGELVAVEEDLLGAVGSDRMHCKFYMIVQIVWQPMYGEIGKKFHAEMMYTVSKTRT